MTTQNLDDFKREDVSKKLLHETEDKNLELTLDESGKKKIAQFEKDESRTKPEKTKLQIYMKRFHGIFFSVISAICLSIYSTLIKKAKIFSGSEQACVQYVLRLIILITIARLKGLNIFGKREERKLLALRGLFGALTMIFMNFSLKLITPSDSVALMHTNIVFISIMARFFLNEKFSLMDFIILILTVIGVVFISQPSFLVGLLFPEKALAAELALKNCTDSIMNLTSVELANSTSNCLTDSSSANLKMYIGIFIGLMSALASSIVAVLLKKLTSIKVHFSIAIVYAAYVGLPIAMILSVIMYFTGLEKKDLSGYTATDIAWQCGYTLTSGLAGICAQVTLQKALQNEDASRVSVIRCTDLFFTFLLQYLLLNLTANVYSTTGAVLIFSATFLTLIHKVLDQKYNSLRKGKKNKSCVKKCVFFEI